MSKMTSSDRPTSSSSLTTLPSITSPSTAVVTSNTAAAAADITSNPYALPNDDVFAFRERESLEKQNAKAAQSATKIWNKTSAAAASSPSSQAKPPQHRYRHTTNLRRRSQSNTHPTTATNTNPNPTPASTLNPPRNKQNLSDFISKKRDMFLLHLSLQLKQSEIEKLEEKATMKEQALKTAELMLEEDAMRFDAFLKDNDRKAHDALKRADAEQKEKNEKLAEIKKLNAELNRIENEMNKYEEQVNAAHKYKLFLEELTPVEFKQKIKERKIKRRNEKKALAAAAAAMANSNSNNGQHHNDDEEKTEDSFAELDDEDEEEDERAHSNTTAVASSSNNKKNTIITTSNTSSTTTAVENDSDDSDSDDDNPMYFTHPSQLLNIFSHLEERNLFLIQNCQESEESVEELKNKYERNQIEMNEQIYALQHNIEEMQQRIDKYAIQTTTTSTDPHPHHHTSLPASSTSHHDLATVTAMHTAVNASSINALTAKIKTVYARCGFDSDTRHADTDALEMLREMEEFLENLIKLLNSLDKNKVELAEKRKNAERRSAVRIFKKQEAERLYEERLKKSMARALTTVVKRTGKQVMFRSAPIKKKVETTQVEVIDEEAEELKKYFT